MPFARSDMPTSEQSGVLIAGIDRGRAVRIEVNGRPVAAFAGESLAAALLRSRHVALRNTAKRSQPRGYYCGMGVCHECLVEVRGRGPTRSCQLAVFDGLAVTIPEAP